MATKPKKAAASGLPEGADPRGLKRVCPACGVKFYDLWQRPAICPACGTPFSPQTGGRPARGAPPRPAEALDGKAAAAGVLAAGAETREEEEEEEVPPDDDEALGNEDDEEDGEDSMGLGIRITEGEKDV
ncbi:MAG: TIGR02300 family protein [Alphaproteobacteria bacterium]|nr:TIGR02300 family protein [Alphaproteobacteria bacterium]